MHLPSVLKFLKRTVHVGVSAAWLCTFGLLRRSDRRRLRAVSDALGYAESRPQLQKRSLESLHEAAGSTTISVVKPQSGVYQVSTYELAAINTLTVLQNPGVVFEIGTFDGRTTRNIALNCSDNTEIYTLDLPEEDLLIPEGAVVGEHIEDYVADGRVNQLRGNSYSYDFSPYAGRVDFMFVDAGHEFEDVQNDTRKALELIADRSATIVWHDYERFSGVTRAVDSFIPELTRRGTFVHIEGTTLACFIQN